MNKSDPNGHATGRETYADPDTGEIDSGTDANAEAEAKAEIEKAANDAAKKNGTSVEDQEKKQYAQKTARGAYARSRTNNPNQAQKRTLARQYDEYAARMENMNAKPVSRAKFNKAKEKYTGRLENLEKATKENIPHNKLSPAFRPKTNIKQHPNRKRAVDSASARSSKNNSPTIHSNPTVGRPHAHPTGRKSREHHEWPGKGFPRNEKY